MDKEKSIKNKHKTGKNWLTYGRRWPGVIRKNKGQ